MINVSVLRSNSILAPGPRIKSTSAGSMPAVIKTELAPLGSLKPEKATQPKLDTLSHRCSDELAVSIVASGVASVAKARADMD